MNPSPCIGLVDDDPATLRALRRLLAAEGMSVLTWGSAEELIASLAGNAPDCLVLDVDMPGLSGLELQERLRTRHPGLPVIFLTGQGDIPMTVRAMKSGAVNFLTKPVQAEELLAAVRAALDLAAGHRAAAKLTASVRRRFAALTPREQEVMAHLITGRLNKQVAADLGTSEQTIKVHRMRIFAKMEVHSVAELVRLADRLELRPAGQH
jgi:FixJ family two-component response regulator